MSMSDIIGIIYRSKNVSQLVDGYLIMIIGSCRYKVTQCLAAKKRKISHPGIER